MAKRSFRVRLTRTVTESVYYEVVADDPDDAEAKAQALYVTAEEVRWRPDNRGGEHYVAEVMPLQDQGDVP